MYATCFFEGFSESQELSIDKLNMKKAMKAPPRKLTKKDKEKIKAEKEFAEILGRKYVLPGCATVLGIFFLFLTIYFYLKANS